MFCMGLMLIRTSYPPQPAPFASVCGSDIWHRLVDSGRQELSGRDRVVRLASHDAIRDHCLVGIDSDVLHNDLLLAATSVLVKSLSQHCHRPRSFVGELQVFRMSLKIMIGRTVHARWYIDNAASFATTNWAISIPSTGSVGFMSTMPAAAADPASETTSAFD